MCPDCKSVTVWLGGGWKPPKQNALKEWRKLELLYLAGLRAREGTLAQLRPLIKGVYDRDYFGDTLKGEYHHRYPIELPKAVLDRLTRPPL